MPRLCRSKRWVVAIVAAVALVSVAGAVGNWSDPRRGDARVQAYYQGKAP